MCAMVPNTFRDHEGDFCECVITKGFTPILGAKGFAIMECPLDGALTDVVAITVITVWQEYSTSGDTGSSVRSDRAARRGDRDPAGDGRPPACHQGGQGMHRAHPGQRRIPRYRGPAGTA